MKNSAWSWALLLLALGAATGNAGTIFGDRLYHVLPKLHGTIVDHTHHHGADRRIWSPALCQRRDLYVYLPPGYDPCKHYPIMLWFHGFLQDEQEFLNDVVIPFDRAIMCGQLPRMIIAAPDGTILGRSSIFGSNSFFLNTKAGKFEDYVIQDVWGFLQRTYPIRPEREAHILAGVSMGGFAAYNLSIKYQDCFKVAIGIYPPLNLRWVDCRGRYMTNFDPCCWGWRQEIRSGKEVIGRFYGGLVTVRIKKMVNPLFDRGPETIERMSEDNPTEMIMRGQLRPGQLDLFVGYGGKDEFNVDAQVNSFLHVARQYAVDVKVCYLPRGRHNHSTLMNCMPAMNQWLTTLIAPLSPD